MAPPPAETAAQAPQPPAPATSSPLGLWAVLLPLLFAWAVALNLLGRPHALASGQRQEGKGPAEGRLHVPVFMMQASTEARHTVRSVLNRARDAYRLELVARMRALDRMVQERLPTWSAHGRMPGLTARLQERVWEGMAGRLPACWEVNEGVLDRLLRLPDVTMGLPTEGQPHASDHCYETSSGNSSSSGGTSGGYNDGVQVLTHLLRDWAEEGSELRRRTYGPVCRAVARLFPDGGARILVPGAGLGRLAFDLAYKHGQRVVALDISPVMAAATASILRLLLLQEGAHTLEFYPCIHDPLINQRSHAARFQRITCPDAAAVQQAQQRAANAGVSSSLSLEIGDLLALADAQSGSQDAVVTCYFIDTGKQILDYLWAIQRLLRPGGVWVNLGPLNYHATLLDGAVQLTLEEVEAAAAEMGLVKQPEWDLVPEPCAYRPDSFSASSAFLRADVYQPAFGVYRKRREEG